MPSLAVLEAALPSCRHCPARLRYDLERNSWACPRNVRLGHPNYQLSGELAGVIYADESMPLDDPPVDRNEAA